MSDKSNETGKGDSYVSSANRTSHGNLSANAGDSGLNALVNNSPQVIQAKAIHQLAQNPIQYKNKSEEGSGDSTSSGSKGLLSSTGSDSPPSTSSGSGSGLPVQLKENMESLSGMSLDDVKVHSNSNKPEEMGAHAYAQGSDIHLGSGQEKHLPHEAWHVVQQKQGRVKPTTQLKSKNINDDSGLEKEADLMGAKAIQMKSKGDSGAEKPSNSGSSSSANSGAVFQLQRSGRTRRRSGTGNRFKKSMATGMDKMAGVNDTTMENASPDMDEGLGVDGTLSVINDSSDYSGGMMESAAEFLGDGTHKDNLGEAASGFGVASNTLGFFSTLYTAVNEGGEMDNFDKIDTVVSFLESGNSFASGISGFVASHASEGHSAKAEKAGGFTDTIGSGLSAIKSFVASIKDIYTMYKDAKADGGSSGKEKFESVMSAIENLLGGVSSSMESSLSIMGMLKETPGAAAGLEKAIPGFSFAIEAINLAMQIYKLINSETARREMYGEKHALKDEFSNNSGFNLTYESRFRKKQKTDTDKIYSSIDDINAARLLDEEIEELKNEKDSYKDQLLQLEKAPKPLTEYQALEVKEFSKQFTISQNLFLSKTAEKQALMVKNRGLKEDNDENAKQIPSLEKYGFTYDMAHLNKKRNAQSIFKIGISLVNIAGKVANLMPGPGTAIGTSLQIAAASAEMGAGLFSTLKQAGRNKAEKYNDAGKTGTLTQKIFNGGKSDKQKNKKRLRNAKYIMKQMAGASAFAHANANTTDENTKKEVGLKIKSVESYIKAAGAHPTSIYRAFLAEANDNARIQAALEALSSAMEE